MDKDYQVINTNNFISIDLDDRALNLKQQSQRYRKDAKYLNTKANMLKYGLGISFVLIILFLIFRYLYL